MEKNTTGVTWLAILMGALLVVQLFGFYIVNSNKNEVNVDLSGIATKTDVEGLKTDVATIQSGLEVLNTETETEVSTESGAYVITKNDFEEKATEDKALELATESINSRDFKKAVFDLLVTEGRNIEDYKHITEIKILDSEADDDEVTFDIKIYYYIDGDEDETERARLDEFKVTIDKLEFDDDFEDAEVDDSYMDLLTVKNIYD